MGSLSTALILLCTVVMSVGFGIFAAYSAVVAILNLFGQANRGVAVLVPSEAPASGD